MRASTRIAGSMSAALMTLAATPALAQITNPDSNTTSNVPVTGQEDRNSESRRRDLASQSLDPVGARFGSFTVLPRIEGALIYDSNIYALERRTDDFIAKVSPSVTVNGDLGVFTTTLRAALDHYSYFDNKRENRTDYAIGGNHRLELEEKTFLTANAAYSRNHEDRGDPNSTQTARSPTTYKLSEAGLGFSRDLSTLRLGADVGVRRYDYNDSARISGGVINNDDRDRTLLRFGGRAGVEFSPGYTVIARAAYDTVNYDDRLDDTGFNRDSHGIRLSAGVGFELTRLLTGEVFAGYLKRNYEDRRFGNISKPLFGAALSYYPTELTTVRVNVDRSVEETVAVGYRGYLATSFNINAEHEITRTLRATAGARFSRNRYERASLATVLPRRENNYGFTAAVRYILNRNIFTSLAYDYSARGSTARGVGSDFKRSKVLATVGLQF